MNNQNNAYYLDVEETKDGDCYRTRASWLHLQTPTNAEVKVIKYSTANVLVRRGTQSMGPDGIPTLAVYVSKGRLHLEISSPSLQRRRISIMSY